MKLLITLLITLLISFDSSASQPKREMSTGWYSWDPYQLEAFQDNQVQLTGLDIALVKSILKEAGFEVVFKPIFWKKQLQNLQEGKQDLGIGATKTKERGEYVYFSKPYRFEENSLFVRRGEEDIFDVSSVEKFLKSIVQNKAKISVIDGFIYADSKINLWLKNPKNQPYILKVQTDQGSIDALLSGKVQGFLADRLVGSTMIWRENLGSKINEVELNLKTPIHLIFSQKTTSLQDIERINKSIDIIRESSQYHEIIRSYLYPVLLLQTASAWWFQFIDILGTFAFAISGLIIAYRQNATIFATFLFALLPSVGGGMMRDLLLQREPIGMLMSPWYLGVVIITVAVAFPLIRLTHRNGTAKLFSFFTKTTGVTLVMFADALGLASFTVTGVVVSVLAQVKPLWLWGGFFVFLTSTGGGILRDIISDRKEITALNGALYAEIALIWGAFLSLFLIYQSSSVSSGPIKYAVAFTVIGTFVTRLLCYFFKIKNIRLKKV